MKDKKRYCFDLDGTLCSKGVPYDEAIPNLKAIDNVNYLYDQGHYIEIATARGSRSGNDWYKLTALQLEEWGVKYNQLSVGAKSYADIFVDDRSITEIKNILAIGAHPDDIEFGCGGTLLKHKQAGDFVVYLCMTGTESVDGVSGNIIRSLEENEEETKKAAKLLKVDKIEHLKFKDLHIPFSFDSVSAIEKIINKYKIDTVYTHWAGDANQDHISTFKATMAASRYVPNVYCYEQIPIPRMSENQMIVNHYVDITDHFSTKLKASKQHKSQFIKYKKIGLNVSKNLKTLAKFRGIQAKVKYAEAFQVIKQVR